MPSSLEAASNLVARAAVDVEYGRPDDAIDALCRAAELHRAGDRRADASHCLCQASTIARLGGDLTRAVALGERSIAAAADRPGLRAALVETAQAAILAGQDRRAAELLGRAADCMEGAPDELIIGVMMKQAECLWSLGDEDAARALWTEAAGLTRSKQQRAQVLIRKATLLIETASADAAAAILAAKAAALDAGDPGAQADALLLQCASALDGSELGPALRAARRARQRALEAGVGMTYLAACVLEARISEERGDRLAAYRSLAVGWVTLEDFAGPELARASFAPRLSELRERWGSEAFAAIKRQHDAGG